MSSRALLIALIICIMVLAGGAFWFFSHRPSPKQVSSNNPVNNAHIAQEQKNGKTTNSPQQTDNTDVQPPATQTNKAPTSSGAANETNQALESPGTYSTFASYYSPNLSTRENTTCVATPGAQCTVEFTQGSITKSLTPQTTDSTGSAYFYWSPSSAELSPGAWTIVLKATLNGASKTAQDSQTLQVKS